MDMADLDDEVTSRQANKHGPSVIVWGGISAKGLIGPIFLDEFMEHLRVDCPRTQAASLTPEDRFIMRLQIVSRKEKMCQPE